MYTKIAIYGGQKQLYQLLRYIYALNQPRITVKVLPSQEPISSIILMGIHKGQPTKLVCHKPLATLTGSFKNIFIRHLHSATAIFYTQIKYCRHHAVGQVCFTRLRYHCKWPG